MHHWKHKILLLGALGLSACGMFQTPNKSTPSTTETTPNPEFATQGTPTVCSNQSAGGSFPYSNYGPLWRQQFFLNDNGTPLNYSTFTTDLPAVGNISMNPYVVNATGGSYAPIPWLYQYIYAPNITLSGTQSTGTVANNAVMAVSGIYGLLYNNSLKQFELPIFSGTSTKFKLFDAAGNVLPTEYGASQTYYPTINNGRVRIPTGQKATLEFYLDPKVQYRKEMIWATFKDASGVSKTDWVTVNMPYQEGILKVNAATYTVQESTGIKTYQSSTNPLPKFKFVMRGYNNQVSADRQFVSRQGIYYTWPSSVTSGNWTAWNQFMDERKDYVLNWNLYDQKVGSASVDASGDPVLNAATVSTLAQWNLGTPGYANDKNCISKTVAPESGVMQRFSVIQPAATVYSGATFTETQQGLKAEYFDNPNFTGKRVERLNSQINFNWGGYSPAPYISPETYSIRWSGTIKPEFSEEYTFYFTGGSGVQLIINGQPVVNNWNITTPSVQSGKVTLKAGESYDLQLSYKHGSGGAVSKLEWQSASRARQLVPADRLSPVLKDIVLVKSILQANSKISGLDTAIDFDRMGVSADKQGGYSFVAPVVNGKGTITGTIVAGGVVSAFRYLEVNGSASYLNVLDGRTANLGDPAQYFNADGTQSEAQKQLFMQKAWSVIGDPDLGNPFASPVGQQASQTKSSGGSFTPLGYKPDPFYFGNGCAGCSVEWDNYIGALLSYQSALVGGSVVCLASIAAGQGYWCAAGVLAGAIALPELYRQTQEAYDKYIACLNGRGDTPGCPPILRYTPQSINDRLRVNTSKFYGIVVENAAPYGASLYISNVRSTKFSGGGELIYDNRDLPLASVLKPGERSMARITAICPAYPTTIRGSFSFDTNDSKAVLSSVDINIECVPPQTIDIRRSNGDQSATVISGQLADLDIVITPNSSNLGYNIKLDRGTLIYKDGNRVRVRAPLDNTLNNKMVVTAQSIEDPAATDSFVINIYPLWFRMVTKGNQNSSVLTNFVNQRIDLQPIIYNSIGQTGVRPIGEYRGTLQRIDDFNYTYYAPHARTAGETENLQFQSLDDPEAKASFPVRLTEVIIQLCVGYSSSNSCSTSTLGSTVAVQVFTMNDLTKRADGQPNYVWDSTGIKPDADGYWRAPKNCSSQIIYYTGTVRSTTDPTKTASATIGVPPSSCN